MKNTFSFAGYGKLVFPFASPSLRSGEALNYLTFYENIKNGKGLSEPHEFADKY
jgi:hypothetical protein